MTPERFRSIVDAYGADARRWPAAEREAAQAWADTHPDTAVALLTHAAQLDAWLMTSRIAPPQDRLVARIIASAPVRKARLSGHSGLWWTGTLACAGLAGGLTGAFVVSFFLLANVPAYPHLPAHLVTAFSAAPADMEGDAE
ncbi:hypothetical protein [Musicola keenii]|uniref:hypothetical protein n=1 Tax=Musicola keenii TaxID=2884250 RepID=UPI00178651B3|nr:hypothetical protein [Musicola keenii]